MEDEVDIIGVGTDKFTKDADTVCLHWNRETTAYGTQLYEVGVVDGGFSVYRKSMTRSM